MLHGCLHDMIYLILIGGGVEEFWKSNAHQMFTHNWIEFRKTLWLKDH